MTRFIAQDVGRVWVGISVYASHTPFDLHATLVRYGRVAGIALRRAGSGHVVDGSKCSAANVFADAVGGLEDTPMAFEVQVVVDQASESNDGLT